MGRSPGARVLMIVGGLLLFGLALRLIAPVYQPVLPPELLKAIGDGWRLLYGFVAPAMPAIAAVGMVVAVYWIAAAWVRKH